jgi:hypothetical protein
MARVQEPMHDERQLERYLLGLLPDADAEQIDELSITDDEIAWRLRAVENDLVDEYVRGTLDANTRCLFEHGYLASPRRREKVKLAQQFLKAVDRVAVPSTSDAQGTAVPAADGLSSRPRSSPSASTTISTLPWRLAVAALVVLACGALLFQNVRLRGGLRDRQREVDALEARVSDLSRELAVRPPSGGGPVTRPERVPDSSGASATTSKAPTPSGALAPTAIALVLPPQTRAIGPVPAIAISPGTEHIAFDLLLESNDFPRYQVTLKDPATDRAVWRSGRLSARVSAAASTITVVLPAALLKPQHYALELEGVRTSGDSEVVTSYAFLTMRR